MAKRRNPGGVAPLTGRQRQELTAGLQALRMSTVEGGWNELSAFDSHESKRQAWEAHRDELMGPYRDCFVRPAAWWIYEHPSGSDPLHEYEAVAALVEAGELTEAGLEAYRLHVERHDRMVASVAGASR